MSKTLVVVFAIAVVALASVDQTIPDDTFVESSAEADCKKDPHCSPPVLKDGDCTLDVTKCLASPDVGAAPAWHAPVLSFGDTYSNLCAQEAFVKKKQEVVSKSAEKNMKEAAQKDKFAESKSKSLEVKLKKSHENMIKMATKVKEVDDKTSTKSVIKEKVMAKTPKSVVEFKKLPTAAPEPAPAPAKKECKYSCDTTKCQCIEDEKGYSKDYCEQMCSTAQCNVKVPKLPVAKKKAGAPGAPATEHTTNEIKVKKVLAVKESVEKTGEKNKKIRCEIEAKQGEKKSKVLGEEIKTKKSESVNKYKVTVPVVHVEGPLADFESGTKKTRELLSKFATMKEQAVKARSEVQQKKEGFVKEVAHKKCSTAHKTCLEIHVASAAKDAAAAELVTKHTKKLKADCAKTLSYENEAADAMRYNVCAAAAQKMKVVIGGLKKSLSTDRLLHFAPADGYGSGPNMFSKFNNETWGGDYQGPGGVNCDKDAKK